VGAEKTKRYWWLKLKDDFFDQVVIKKLRRMAGGDTYTIIYLKMQLLSLQNEGVILFEGVEDSLEEELSLHIDETVENIQMTLLFLKKHSLLETLSEFEHVLPETVKNIGSEGLSAARMRNLRAKQTSPSDALTSQSAHNVVTCDTEIRVKREIPPISPKGDDDVFEKFWKVYPRKVAKQKAQKAWTKLKVTPELSETIIAAVEAQKLSGQLQREDSRFIPYPATWLNSGSWEDEVEAEEIPKRRFVQTGTFDNGEAEGYWEDCKC